jgi:hypothetical protein
MQEFQLFGPQRGEKRGHPGEVTGVLVETGADRKDNRISSGRRLCDQR